MAKKLLNKLNLKRLPLSAIVAQMCSKYGKNSMVIASQALGLHVRHLSTGVYALDLALNGGIPENRITELFGSYSALKSTICNNVIRSFQQTYGQSGRAFYEDGERSFSPAYAKSCGVDLDQLALINSVSGDQSIDMLAELIGIGAPVLCIIDSIASLVPNSELESSTQQQHQGLHPRLVGRLMRVLTGGLNRSLYDARAASTTVLATNQTREKIGVMYGNPETTPGGKAKDFYYSVRVRLASGASDKIMEKVVANGVERERRVGQVVRFDIRKNKVGGSQFEEGDFTYFIRPYKGHPAYSFNNEEILFRYGVFYGIIRRVALKSGEPGYKYGNICTAEGQEDLFKKRLVERPNISSALFAEILDVIINESRYGVSADKDNPDHRASLGKPTAKVKIIKT